MARGTVVEKDYFVLQPDSEHFAHIYDFGNYSCIPK
jgi:hypothetical protein